LKGEWIILLRVYPTGPDLFCGGGGVPEPRLGAVFLFFSEIDGEGGVCPEIQNTC